jgi:DNA-binding HxlR family transcriptional regulator
MSRFESVTINNLVHICNIVNIIYYIIYMNMFDAGICPQVESAFALLAKKWTGLILFALRGAPRHFAELKATIPDLSGRVLTLRLRELESSGLVERKVQLVTPVRVSYELTKKGMELAEIMGTIAEWART